MKNSRDELMEEFNRILIATDGSRPLTEEEYKDLERGIYSTPVGETEWAPEVEKVEEPKEEESPPGWPKKVKHQDGTVVVYKNPKEWRDAARKKYNIPEPEQKQEKYTDEEVMKMIKEDPSHVVTNLMLQRKPEYKHLMYPMLRAFVDWMMETGVSPKKGTILYDEANYMLSESEHEADIKETEKSDKLEEGRRVPPIQSGEAEWKE